MIESEAEYSGSRMCALLRVGRSLGQRFGIKKKERKKERKEGRKGKRQINNQQINQMFLLFNDKICDFYFSLHFVYCKSRYPFKLVMLMLC